MFGLPSDPEAWRLLLRAVACLALAGMAALLPLPWGLRWALSALGLAGGLVCGILALHRRRDARYDLGALRESPTADEEPDYELGPDEPAAPYCAWCDAALAPGTRRCPTCGRSW